MVSTRLNKEDMDLLILRITNAKDKSLSKEDVREMRRKLERLEHDGLMIRSNRYIMLSLLVKKTKDKEQRRRMREYITDLQTLSFPEAFHKRKISLSKKNNRF